MKRLMELKEMREELKMEMAMNSFDYDSCASLMEDYENDVREIELEIKELEEEKMEKCEDKIIVETRNGVRRVVELKIMGSGEYAGYLVKPMKMSVEDLLKSIAGQVFVHNSDMQKICLEFDLTVREYHTVGKMVTKMEKEYKEEMEKLKRIEEMKERKKRKTERRLTNIITVLRNEIEELASELMENASHYQLDTVGAELLQDDIEFVEQEIKGYEKRILDLYKETKVL